MRQQLAPANVTPAPVTIERVEACAWCWPILHPTTPYPAAWSSTICETHRDEMVARHAQLRAARAAAMGGQASC